MKKTRIILLSVFTTVLLQIILEKYYLNRVDVSIDKKDQDFCFAMLNGGVQSNKVGCPILIGDTILLSPFLQVSYIDTDEVENIPIVYLFIYSRHKPKFICIDTILYTHLEKFQYIPTDKKNTELYGAIILKEKKYHKLSFTFSYNLNFEGVNIDIKKRSERFDEFQSFIKNIKNKL